jgi:ATP-dependent DNA helicase RecG
LLNLSQTVLEQLLHKFLIRKVSFEGLYRRETPEYPITALREVILNALVHRNYMGAPTQIRVYDDKITFWNDGRLSEELTLEDLKKIHPSKPRNPIIADVCFKGNLIDAWGRGTIKVIDACIDNQLPEPELTERNGGFLATIFGKGSEELRKGLGKGSERARKGNS